MDDDIGLSQAFDRPQRQEIGIAGTGADKYDGTPTCL